MTELIIAGGVPLRGTVQVSGAKNAALPMMAAAILADGAVELHGVPHLTDVRTMGRLLVHLGMDISHQGDRLTLATIDRTVVQARYDMVRRVRAGFCVLGPLFGAARQGDRAAARRLRYRRPAGRSASSRSHRNGSRLAARTRLHRGHRPAALRCGHRSRGTARSDGDGHGERPFGGSARPRANNHQKRGPGAGDCRSWQHAHGNGPRRIAGLGTSTTGNQRRRATRRLPLALDPRPNRSGHVPLGRRDHRRRSDGDGSRA